MSIENADTSREDEFYVYKERKGYTARYVKEDKMGDQIANIHNSELFSILPMFPINKTNISVVLVVSIAHGILLGSVFSWWYRVGECGVC